MTTLHLRQALRKRYALPEWVLMEEVRDAAGFQGQRAADGIAMSMWPSRGLEIHGFELKASRSDWLRELKNPAKAEAIASYCDRWFIVATPGIVKPDEMPRTWGLYEVDGGGRFKTIKDAPRNENVQPLTRTFVAAMMRRCGEHDQLTLRMAVQSELEAIRKDVKDAADREVKSRLREWTEVRKKLAAVKEATGIDLLSWQHSSDAVTDAIKFALKAHDLTGSYAGLRSLRHSLSVAIKSIDECKAVLPASDEETEEAA